MADLGSSKIFGNLTVIHDAEVKGVITGDGSGLNGIPHGATTFANQNLNTGDSPTFSQINLTSDIKSTKTRLSFLNGSNALPINTNELLVSSSYADSSLVPANGAYVKGNIGIGGIFNGNGSGLTNLNASNLSSGTVSYTRLPISSSQVSNWDTAHSWGDHSLAGYAVDSSISAVGKSGAWLDITGKPATATRWPTYAEVTGKPTLNISNWNTAHSWGNHANAGYALSSGLSPVATTGSYNDLTNKPSLVTQADLEELEILALAGL